MNSVAVNFECCIEALDEEKQASDGLNGVRWWWWGIEMTNSGVFETFLVFPELYVDALIEASFRFDPAGVSLDGVLPLLWGASTLRLSNREIRRTFKIRRTDLHTKMKALSDCLSDSNT